MAKRIKVIDFIFHQNFDLYFQIRKEMRSELRKEVKRELKNVNSNILHLRNERYYLLKELRDKYGFDGEAIKELRAASHIRNITPEDKTPRNRVQALKNLSPRFAEEYDKLIADYNDYTGRIWKGASESGDWKFKKYNNPVDYANTLYCEIISKIRRIERFERNIIAYVCEDDLEEFEDFVDEDELGE